MAYEFQLTRRVEFSDTDMAGIMHFSNFFRFMEAAEHAFFRSLGFSVVLSGEGLHLPRVHAECDYLAPLRFEDQVLIHLLVQKKGTRSLTYQFRFHRLGETREAARGTLTVVCAKRLEGGTFRAARLPKVIREKIEEAPASMLNGAVNLAGRAAPERKLRGRAQRPLSRTMRHRSRTQSN